MLFCLVLLSQIKDSLLCFVGFVLLFLPPRPPLLVSQFRRRRLSKIQSDAAASLTNLQRCKQTSAPLRSRVTLALAAITRTRDLQTSMQICFFIFLLPDWKSDLHCFDLFFFPSSLMRRCSLAADNEDGVKLQFLSTRVLATKTKKPTNASRRCLPIKWPDFLVRSHPGLTRRH